MTRVFTVGQEIDRHDWSKGWTTAEFYTIGGVTYLLLLKKGKGMVHIHRMNTDGTVGPQIITYDWSTLWTTAEFYTIGGITYLFLLKESDGVVNIYRINTDGTVGAQVRAYDWSKGWTTAEFYTIGGVTYLLLLKKGKGMVHIHRMNTDGTVGPQIITYDWSTLWTTAEFYTIGGVTYLFLLKEHDGVVNILKIIKSSILPLLELTASVGQRGTNNAADILALKKELIGLGFNWLTIDPAMNDETIYTIKLFQSIIRGNDSLQGDGLVEVPGFTYDWLRASNAPCWQLMPEAGDGFTNIERLGQPLDNHDFGTDWMATVIQSVGVEYEYSYQSGHLNSALISVNDVSLPRGGNTPDHGGHETGLNCDIQLPDDTGNSGGITWNDLSYDRNAMRAMLTVINNQSSWRRTLLDDPVLIREGLCSPSPLLDHHDHAHFEINPPARID